MQEGHLKPVAAEWILTWHLALPQVSLGAAGAGVAGAVWVRVLCGFASKTQEKVDFRTVLPKLQPRVDSHLVGGYFSSQEASSPSVQLFRENSRSTAAHSEGINPCGVHRSSQLLWVCLDNELVLSDSAQAPCQPQCHPPGRESAPCHSMDCTLAAGWRIQPSFSQLGNQGTACFPLHLVLQRLQEVQLLQQD